MTMLVGEEGEMALGTLVGVVSLVPALVAGDLLQRRGHLDETGSVRLTVVTRPWCISASSFRFIGSGTFSWSVISPRNFPRIVMAALGCLFCFFDASARSTLFVFTENLVRNCLTELKSRQSFLDNDYDSDFLWNRTFCTQRTAALSLSFRRYVTKLEWWGTWIDRCARLKLNSKMELVN